MNIVLIGYRCSGKSAVGQILAKKLGRDFVDTDALIQEASGCSIETLVSRSGWRHFREIEKRVIKAVSTKNKQVVATGGGAVMDTDNVKRLKTKSWIVWLDATPEVLSQRMAEDQARGNVRPSLTGGDAKKEIAAVLADRRADYERAGDYRIDTDNLSVHEIIDLIMGNMPDNDGG